MAIGILTILTVILALLILGSIVLGFLKRDHILNEAWFIYGNLILIILLTFMSFTALPSNYIIYKIITIILGVVGLLALYLNKIGKLKHEYALILITISLLGNFLIGFLL